MAQRTVFGRRRADFEEFTYIIEMSADGISIRRKRYHKGTFVPFAQLLKVFLKPQLDLPFNGLDKSQQTPALPSVPEGQLVPPQPGAPDCNLHAGDIAESKTLQGREPGLDSPAEPGPTAAATEGNDNRPTHDQLSSVD